MLTQGIEDGEELQLTGREGFLQVLQKQSSEQTWEHPDREEEAGLAGDPSIAVARQAAAHDHTMQMRMMKQVLAQVCSTPKKPISAPRCLRSAAMVRRVSAAARKSRP